MKRSPLRARRPDTAAADRRWSHAVLKRAGWVCEARLPVCTGAAEHAHHVVARSQRPDLRWDTRVGIAVCYRCHAHIHAHPAAAKIRGLTVAPWEADAWLTERPAGRWGTEGHTNDPRGERPATPQDSCDTHRPADADDKGGDR